MKVKILLPLLLTIVSLSFIACGKNAGSGPDDKIVLALNTKVGDKQSVSTDIDQHITTKVMDQELKINQHIIMDMTMVTKEVKDSATFVYEGRFDRWAMKMDMNGAGMSNSAEFDTQDTTKTKGEMAPMMQQMFAKMIGQPFTMEMSKNGKMISTNMKEVMAKILPPGSSNSFSNDAMSTIPFPDHPVKAGDTWKSDIERDLSGKKAVVKAEYTLKEVKDGVAHLAVVGEVVDKDSNKKMGTLTGTYSIGATNGMLKDADLKMLMDMEVDNPAGTKQQVKLDQTIKMRGKI